ncbi:MAG: hypothetical protein GWO11_04805 [Desulfuromonadales bacterium]|nr:hypothetical protein [Desulfuromonadales bacterium]NIR33730.1 hypothetical protein [Desulfuromonadales bacterium]NIS39881.1 hypothetical protein [Desulfuromonadales bacterium]
MPQLTCPHCGLTKEVSGDNFPSRPVKVTCPRCRDSFVFPAEGPETAASPGELTDIGDLFAAAWEIYRQRLGTLIPLSFISLLVILVPVAIFVAGGYFVSVFVGYREAFSIAGAVTGALVGAIAFIWAMAALTFAAVDESLGIKASMSCAWTRLGAFVWVFSLLPIIILGGYFLFLIPGLIFSVLFIFAQYILAAEDVRGMNALLKSREYVRGYGWPVFLRLIVIWLATGLVTSLLNMAPVIGSLATYFVTPYVFIYTVLVYRDLRRIKGDVAYDSSPGAKFLWLFLGALGFIVFFGAIAAMVISGTFTQMQIN